MKIHLAGHLSWYQTEKKSWFEMELLSQTRLADLLEQLGIPQGEVAIALVNGKPADMETVPLQEDVVELFPPAAGG